MSKSACSSQKFCACVFLCPAVFQLVCHIPFSIQPNFLSLAVSVSLQAAVEDRLKLLQEAHRDFGPSSQHFLSSESKHMNKFTVSCQLYFTGLQCSLKRFVVLAKANFTTTNPPEKTSMSSPWLVLVSLKLVWLVDQHST